jgi:hypothetical protein
MTKLREIFGVDLRSLALFRIALGASLLVDLVMRARDLTAHYTDQGLLPRALLLPFGRLTIPLHRMAGGAAYEAALFVVAGLVAAAFTVGYKTRAATVVSWLLLQSLHDRNRLILDGGDPLLRIMLFWSMFLPLGARFSWDRRRAREAPAMASGGQRVTSFATAALLVQIASMYLFTGLLKLEFPVWPRGTALGYALLAYHMTTPLGTALLAYPRLLFALGMSVLVWEVAGPLLWFSPWRTGPMRAFTTAGFLALQLGIAACMTIGNFQPSAMVLVLPFLPGWFWDDLLPKLFITRRAEAHAQPDDTPQPTSRASRALDATALALAVYVFVCNVGTLFVKRDLPGRPERLAYLLGIDQRWDMFGGPRRPTGYTVVASKLADGTEVDLLHGGAVSWDKPENPADMYANWRWRRYMIWYVWTPRGEPYRPAFAAYLCRTWNGGHPEAKRALSIEMTWVRQITEVDFTLRAPERVLVYQGDCPREGT